MRDTTGRLHSRMTAGGGDSGDGPAVAAGCSNYSFNTGEGVRCCFPPLPAT